MAVAASNNSQAQVEPSIPNQIPLNIRTETQQSNSDYFRSSHDAVPEPKSATLAAADDHEDGSTPQHRRSVQFARDTDFHDASVNPISNPTVPDTPPHEASSSYRQRERLRNRMRSFGLQKRPPSHIRTRSSITVGGDGDYITTPGTEAPAQSDMTDGEMADSSVPPSPAPFSFSKKKRKAPPDWLASTEPNTPMEPGFHGNHRTAHSQSPARHQRPKPPRRATMTDVPEGLKEGVSEDEGRARLSQSPGWRLRSSAWLRDAQNQSFMARRRASRTEETPERRGLRLLRRAGTGNEETQTPSRLKMTEAREKWRRIAPKVMTAMRMRTRRPEKKGVDYVKSAELMAELIAGSPAAIIFASHFQPDELRRKKVPVLLEQLKIRIPTVEKTSETSERHAKFKIELEYGNGLMRMDWSIDRYLSDFINLHLKYTGSQLTDWRRRGVTSGSKKLPRFPKSSFPVLKSMVGASMLPDEEEEEKDKEKATLGAADKNGEESAVEDAPQTPAGPGISHRRRASQHVRAYSSGAIRGLGRFPGRSNTSEGDAMRREEFATRQRRKLEQYLREMIRYFMFRGGSNRLCRFLEISALGVNLAAEGGYHGKEGTLHIKQPGTLHGMRHSKWFLVRDSYVACVDSPEETSLLDVFFVDSQFDFSSKLPRIRDQKTARDMAKTAKGNAGKSSNHRLRLRNSERKLTLYAKNERQQEQFAESVNKMWKATIWAQKQRFGSFAPVRHNVHAEWLVDARDYMWKLSRAIDMAENVIYIHDWWLSPELYLRRPPSVSHNWRLDRLLQRKAREGVKIFVIMYRNINSAIPIDSEYSKQALLDLHPNIYVQRSPNQVYQSTFFWAHHEKICVVDNIVAFCGGVDLCFGRWDTPDHVLVDDKRTGHEDRQFSRDAEGSQLWPGKDYSNPRVQDFYDLFEPYGEMYDRTKTPRMPWHDIGMQLSGQPARDLGRHFAQRWNYLLRQRKAPGRRGPTRPIPMLLPSPDLTPEDLAAMRMNGTCEVQMLRSCGEWSIGTPDRTEHSIQEAYIKLIETSDHFIYIENQFFVSSGVVDGTPIKNKIGDALVERIKRAHANDEDWAAVIVIPLMPGFQNAVDNPDGTSVRLIMESQYRSICRGEHSMFGKLRAVGIDPHDYIQFYSLRQWSKIGPSKALTTEQLYIHAKCMVVDDRAVVIGSANINERSMRGDRDSEVAACVRDRNMIDSTMAGRPYQVAKFAHTLRVRLMREHLGTDVDSLRNYEVEDWSASRALQKIGEAMNSRNSENNRFTGFGSPGDVVPNDLVRVSVPSSPKSNAENESVEKLESVSSAAGHTHCEYGRDSRILTGGREVLMGSAVAEGKGTVLQPQQFTSASANRAQISSSDPTTSPEGVALPPMPPRTHSQEVSLTQLSQLPPLPETDDSDIGGPLVKTFTEISATTLNAFISEINRPVIEDNCMRDPLVDSFLHDTWHTVAENNTKIYRQVFRCQPDNEVTTWDHYKAFDSYSARLNEEQGIGQSRERVDSNTPSKTGPPGTGTEDLVSDRISQLNSRSVTGSLKETRTTEDGRRRAFTNTSAAPSLPRIRTASSARSQARSDRPGEQLNEKQLDLSEGMRRNVEIGSPPVREGTSNGGSLDETKESGSTLTLDGSAGMKKRRRATTRSSGAARGNDSTMNRDDAEQLLRLIQGHLVVFPYDWWVLSDTCRFCSC